MESNGLGFDRRSFVRVCAGFGLAGAALELLWARAGEGPITRETLAGAEALAGSSLRAGSRAASRGTS